MRHQYDDAARQKAGQKSQERADRDLVEVVRMLADGHTYKSCGRALSMEWKSVMARVYRAKRRHGAKTLSHLVAIYFRKRWIS